MSTRVQKGATVFKPVARPRPRPGGESRQASVTSDSRAAVNHPIAQNMDPPPPSTAEMPPPNSSHTRTLPSKASGPSIPPLPSNAARGSSLIPTDNETQENIEQLSRKDGSRPLGVPIQAPSMSRTSQPSVIASPRTIVVPTERGARRPDAAEQARNSVAIASGSQSAAATQSVEDLAAAAHMQQNLPSFQNLVDVLNSVQYIPLPAEVPSVESTASDPQTSAPTQSYNSHQMLLPQEPQESSSSLAAGSWDMTSPALEGNYSQAETVASDANTSTFVPYRRGPKPAADVSTGTVSKQKRSRSTVEDPSQSDVGEGSQSTTRKRKARDANAPRKARKQDHASIPFDPTGDPGEEIDPTVVTMSALCDDTGQGRVSSNAAQIVNNHAAWRAASREKRARFKTLIEAKKYGRSLDDDDQPSNSGTTSSHNGARTTPALPPSAAESAVDPSSSRDPVVRDDFDYNQDLATSRYNVRVRIGANGETIIDEESLFVNRNEEEDTQNYTHVEESDTTKFVNSHSYSKKARGSRWSAEETELFYDALSQFGENYELISYVLPGRDRKACKNKFKAEDKKNPNRITYCLNNRRPFDIQTLSRMTGKDFSGPTPIIRAPTPLQSTQLDPTYQSETLEPAHTGLKRNKDPDSNVDEQEEILGDIEDIEKEDSLSVQLQEIS